VQIGNPSLDPVIIGLRLDSKTTVTRYLVLALPLKVLASNSPPMLSAQLVVDLL